MPQAKKKTATKTAAKRTAKTSCAKKTCAKKVNQAEKYHVYIITALSMFTAILLCADAILMMA